MAVSENELEEKRRRVESLRSEIRSLDTAAVGGLAEAANDLAAAQLDREIETLERQRDMKEETNKRSLDLARSEMARLVGGTPVVETETTPTGVASAPAQDPEASSAATAETGVSPSSPGSTVGPPVESQPTTESVTPPLPSGGSSTSTSSSSEGGTK